MKDKERKELTRAEEQLMQILWKIERGFVNDILQHFPYPKPAYNTVSTIVRILEKKKFVSYHAFGRAHQYYALISREEYTKMFMSRFMKGYFSNSYKEMVSFFTRDKNISINDLEEIRKIMDDEIKKQKGK